MNPGENGILSRREFAIQTTLGVAGLACFPGALAANSKPNSKVAGVQIGLNVPYSFGNMQMSAEEILNHCVQLGFSAVELRTQPVEVFLGAPNEWVNPPKNGASGQAAANAKEFAEWRNGVSIKAAKAVRKMYKDAGVAIEIVKVDGIFKMTDDELDYVFNLAKALGGRAISTEISKKEDDLKRIGQFADKHRLMVGYHGHATTTPQDWEKAFSLAKYNGANLDLGHFVAGNNGSPVEFIKQHHARITHVHVKDRKMNNGPNTPFGEGDTPVKEALQTIRDHKWNIQATIEFEYKVPAGSDRMTEIARALKYCRDSLAQG
jgi:sugar phosphate isomerase/epimerase